MAVRLAQAGYIPAGALTLPTADRGTLLRKLGQWGVREVVRYARAKMISRGGKAQSRLRNPYLAPLLSRKGKAFRNLREVAAADGFPIVTCSDQNSRRSIAQLRAWSPDLVVFAGGSILRKPLLAVPRMGAINVHLALLPEIRGMNSPEWSLLKDIPSGVTIHYMDAGIDTGPILRRCEFADGLHCQSLEDLRNRLIAFGIEKAAEVVAALDQGSVSATPQPEIDSEIGKDNQFFVMHEWLQARAAEKLMQRSFAAAAGKSDG
jgi:folate-dependent phosphoribosylglycinamide formyltransferase PurN